MQQWAEIRRRVLNGEISKRAARAEYDIHWETLQKILTHSEPPGYRRAKPRVSKLEPFLPVIHEICKHRKKDVLPLHPHLTSLLRQWLPEYPSGQPLFPKLGKRKAYTMIRKDLEAAEIPYTTKDGDADFHAAGRHSYITGLLKNGTSLVVARELARHADVKMTMRYTHIGLQDQAKGIQNLPTDPKWLEYRRSTESVSQHISSSSQHICSKSCVCEGQSETPEGSECHSKCENEDHASADEESPSGSARQKKTPPVTGDVFMEAAGFRNENRNPMKTKALRIQPFSNWTQLWPILAA